MIHMLRFLVKIVHNWVYARQEEDIRNTQFEFRKSLGIKEALFAYKVLTQWCLDIN